MVLLEQELPKKICQEIRLNEVAVSFMLTDEQKPLLNEHGKMAVDYSLKKSNSVQ